MVCIMLSPPNESSSSFLYLVSWELEVEIWFAMLEYHGLHNALAWQMILDGLDQCPWSRKD